MGSTARFIPGAGEWFWAIKGITMGFEQLLNACPANAHLVFSPAIHHVEIDLDPATVPKPKDPARPTLAEFESCEQLWRDKALLKLGVGTGHAGFRNLVNKSNFLFTPDWAFVLIVTKYPAALSAYAPDYRDVVISFDMFQKGLGLPLLPSAIAHEIGHTVGALDEYSPCSVLSKCGFSNFVNANCEVGNPLSTDCLMKNPQKSSSICMATRSHFGWADQNLNGILDPFDTGFVPFP
jgi:hypothetical protein